MRGIMSQCGGKNAITVLSTHKMNKNDSSYAIELDPKTNALYLMLTDGRQYIISISRSYDYQAAIRRSNSASYEVWIRFSRNLVDHYGIDTVSLQCEETFSWSGVDVVKEVLIQPELT